MNTSELLEKAISIAVESHSGQKDKYGAPYILRTKNAAPAFLPALFDQARSSLPKQSISANGSRRSGSHGRVRNCIRCCSQTQTTQLALGGRARAASTRRGAARKPRAPARRLLAGIDTRAREHTPARKPPVLVYTRQALDTPARGRIPVPNQVGH